MSPFASPIQRSAHSMYSQVGAETAVAGASPHRLVAMLFEGLIDAMVQAKNAMRKGDIAVKGRFIGRAVSILDEGLKAGLNLNDGGSLAGDLNELYSYAIRRLTE